MSSVSISIPRRKRRGREEPNALDRTHPQHGSQAKRNGTTTLAAGAGKVIGQCYQRHDTSLPALPGQRVPGKDSLALGAGNYGTHTHANVKAWLKRALSFIRTFQRLALVWRTHHETYPSGRISQRIAAQWRSSCRFGIRTRSRSSGRQR